MTLCPDCHGYCGYIGEHECRGVCGVAYNSTNLKIESLSKGKDMTDRELLILYLMMKARQEDWHGVSDAANNLREMDARQSSRQPPV